MAAPDQPVVRRRVIVDGRVQGVFFRATCAREAARRGVCGWVRNTADGGVEAVFEGAGGAVDAMIAWSRQGSPGAAVVHIEVRSEPPEGLDGFRIIG
jgi:acylphosphatase